MTLNANQIKKIAKNAAKTAVHNEFIADSWMHEYGLTPREAVNSLINEQQLDGRDVIRLAASAATIAINNANAAIDPEKVAEQMVFDNYADQTDRDDDHFEPRAAEQILNSLLDDRALTGRDILTMLAGAATR